MHPIRSLVIGSVVLTGCIAAAPAEVAPDPAVAAKIRQLSGGNVCSDRIAGVLTAHRIGADMITGLDQPPVGSGSGRGRSTNRAAQRQAWLKLAEGGAIVVQYEPSGCRIAAAYARDGAVLPAAG